MSHRTPPQGTATATVLILAALTLGAAAGLVGGWHAITDDWGTTVHTLIGATVMTALVLAVLYTVDKARQLVRAYRRQP